MADIAVEIEYLATRLDPITVELKCLISLKEINGNRIYIIEILPEKCALLYYLKYPEDDIQVEIPFVSAYKLIRDLINKVGLFLNSLAITGQNLTSKMITSHLVLRKGEEVVNCDLQNVTDGIIIAIQNNIPIFISEELLLDPDQNKIYQFLKTVEEQGNSNHVLADDQKGMMEFLENLDDSKMPKH